MGASCLNVPPVTCVTSPHAPHGQHLLRLVNTVIYQGDRTPMPALTQDELVEDVPVTLRIGAMGTSDVFDRDAYTRLLASMGDAPARYLVSTYHTDELHDMLTQYGVPTNTEVHIGAVVTSAAQAREALPRIGNSCSFLHVTELHGPLTADFLDILTLDAVQWVVMGDSCATSVMHPDWVRDLRDHCVLSGISFDFAGWGAWVENVTHCGRERVVRVPRTVSDAFCAVHVSGKVALCPANPYNPFPYGETGWTVLRKAGNSDDTATIDGRGWSEAPFELHSFPGDVHTH